MSVSYRMPMILPNAASCPYPLYYPSRPPLPHRYPYPYPVMAIPVSSPYAPLPREQKTIEAQNNHAHEAHSEAALKKSVDSPQIPLSSHAQAQAQAQEQVQAQSQTTPSTQPQPSAATFQLAKSDTGVNDVQKTTFGMQTEKLPEEQKVPDLPRTQLENAPEEKKEKIKNNEDPLNPFAAAEKFPAAGANTYKHRNVYKSIIRHMFSCIKKNKNDLATILQNSGFSMSEVEHAFYEIGCYNDMERQKGKKKVSQSLVRKIATDKTIYTHILRETLNTMLTNWDLGKFGRLTKKNLGTYKDLCAKYYNETVEALGKPAQGKSFLL